MLYKYAILYESLFLTQHNLRLHNHNFSYISKLFYCFQLNIFQINWPTWKKLHISFFPNLIISFLIFPSISKFSKSTTNIHVIWGIKNYSTNTTNICFIFYLEIIYSINSFLKKSSWRFLLESKSRLNDFYIIDYILWVLGKYTIHIEANSKVLVLFL